MSHEPEVRTDPLTGERVIFATSRSQRPNEFVREAVRRDQADCPFCVGNEIQTPKEVFAFRDANDGDDRRWQVRVVPNKFPALTLESAQPGIHEVFIESPNHVMSYSEVTVEQAHLIFQAYRQRVLAASATAGIRFAQVFKNVGPTAGASIEHVHSQLIATNETPPAIQRLLDRARLYLESSGCCYYCHLIEQEVRERARIVAATERFVALCPYASRCPLETWIIPRQHASRFELSDDQQLLALAELVRDIVQRIERNLDGVAYNVILRTSPFGSTAIDYYHWHVEILPRIASLAGFEWATGCFINATYPEDAARQLSNVPAGKTR